MHTLSPADDILALYRRYPQILLRPFSNFQLPHMHINQLQYYVSFTFYLRHIELLPGDHYLVMIPGCLLALCIQYASKFVLCTMFYELYLLSTYLQ